MIAYAWATGQIEFGYSVPEGALHIAKGPKKKLRDSVSVIARHGKGWAKDLLLVPGIPEASSSTEKIGALIAFQQQVLKAMGRGD